MNTINSSIASIPQAAGGYRPTPGDFNVTASFRDIQSYIDGNKDNVAPGKSPYVLDGNLHFPSPRNLFTPTGARVLPVSTRALKNIVDNFIDENPRQAKKNLVFLDRGPLAPPGHVAVTAEGSGLELFYRVADGKPMGS